MKHLFALLATARIANVPSVVSNVIFGALLVGSQWQQQIHMACTAAIAACLLYVAGNFFNDWHDAAWDRENRPERGIPSGLFPRNTYLFTALAFTAISLFLGFSAGILLGASLTLIVLLVMIYTIIHKKSAYGIWVMGACRAMLYAVGIFSVLRDSALITQLVPPTWAFHEISPFFVVIVAPMAGMLCYIAGISLLAKQESKSQHTEVSLFLPRLLVFLPIVTHGLLFACLLGSKISALHVLFHALVVFGGWTYWAVMKERTIGERVARLLMGIPLIDGIRLTSILTMSLMGQSVGNSSHLIILCLPFLSFILAGILQKVAPAS